MAHTTHGEDWDIFADIERVNAWLDSSNPRTPHDDSMRVMKVGEEIGEVIGAIVAANGRACAAYIGMTGQNPRKGVTHTQYDVLAELADVVITGLCAIQHFTGDIHVTAGIMANKLTGIIVRSEIADVNQPALSMGPPATGKQIVNPPDSQVTANGDGTFTVIDDAGAYTVNADGIVKP